MTASHKRANYARYEIERDYPHQVALPDEMCCMENYGVLDDFCRQLGARFRTTSVIAIWECGKEEQHRLYCFSERDHALSFAAHFEGALFDPAKDRGNGQFRNPWRRAGKWRRVTACGPLRLPRFFVDNP